jgi:(2Fe-2S) ferredoxin
MFDLHVFVCTNTKEGKVSCGPQGSEALCEEMKKLSKSTPELRAKKIRVNKSGCLGICEEGPNVVIYPEGTWYTHVQPSDAKAIVESHLQDGVIVERIKRVPPGAAKG